MILSKFRDCLEWHKRRKNAPPKMDGRHYVISSMPAMWLEPRKPACFPVPVRPCFPCRLGFAAYRDKENNDNREYEDKQ